MLALATTLAACGGGTSAGERDARRPPAPGTFTNPVFRKDFPDPFVLAVGHTYYAYATNSGDQNVQTLRSRDLVTWRRGPDAMPELASWAIEGKTWAPEVLAVGKGRYVLYYTARSLDPAAQCVGRAVAASPAGPFVDRTSAPLVCQKAEGGSIDASPFRDADGRLYLLWKNDGNCCGLATYLYAQRLSRNGLRLVGKRARLVKEDADWEGALVEAPTLWRHGPRYFLFFSANAYDSESYAVGYATCQTPFGPCRDAAENPILETTCRAAGPGHQTIVEDDDGETWVVYHAWPPDSVGAVDPGRVLWIDRLLWRDGRPDVAGPTCGPQRRP